MARKPEVHTVPKSTGGWANKVSGQTVTQHRTKDNAVHQGRTIARQLGTEHAIHNRDGKIGEKNSYGNDPIPPRDKNR